jgi:soluble lytic murein transglycosylase-like protein
MAPTLARAQVRTSQRETRRRWRQRASIWRQRLLRPWLLATTMATAACSHSAVKAESAVDTAPLSAAAMVFPAGPRAEAPWIGPDVGEDTEAPRRPPLAVGERAALAHVEEDAALDANHHEDDLRYQRTRSLSFDSKMRQRCRQYRPAIERAAQKAGVDPMLMMALAWVESGFSAGVRSSAGARGLMQLTPVTASAMGCRDIYDPGCSAEAASKLVAWLLRKYQGEVVYALCAYNSGPARPTRAWRKGELPGNMGFATRVLEARNRIERSGCD